VIGTIHPFPARMAPELALDTLNDLTTGSVVLDPMSGSGTVVRQACELGLVAQGFDMDPLAVLMSRAWNTYVEDSLIGQVTSELVAEARETKLNDIELPWIDGNAETSAFVKFWFGRRQRGDLRRLAWVLNRHGERRVTCEKHAAADVLRIALSRIIVTKDSGASLARDVSHSRPHKVADETDYDVFKGLERSIRHVRRKLQENPPWGGAYIALGDARALSGVEDRSIDAVVTSPPYLNAIDYMRGHRMSLVWLGHPLGDLRAIRSDSIGAERAPDGPGSIEFEAIERAMVEESAVLPARYRAMVRRYSEDIYQLLSETARVLKNGAVATFVVGNSCLKGVFVKNSGAVQMAAEMAGLRTSKVFERQLPGGSRYLPLTIEGALGKRMRTETVLNFVRL
jgi:hypothetical protein